MHLKDIAPGHAARRSDRHRARRNERADRQGPGELADAAQAGAEGAGVKMFYIEDEHPHAEAQMPESLRYLATL